MNDYKEVYLVDFSINHNDLRQVRFQSQFEAERVACALKMFFRPDEIKLLQVRIRYDKFEEDDE